KNMISPEEAWEVAQKSQVPLIIDAAAEEDLQKYVQLSDLVIYSGSKALEGPTSGIVAGKQSYIDWLQVQLHGIGRSMKVGKETAFGLLQALEEYKQKADRSDEERNTLRALVPLNELPGVQVEIVQDEAGRRIFRGRIFIDDSVASLNAFALNEALRAGEIAIYTRDYGVHQGYFDIDPRPLKNDDIEVIRERIWAILGGK
ncbi:SelA-like pyridoxal phosphate-dependent enzyme, partial [Bacillaceae bacterium SIJ1]|nr:SelA-like pyridoxal phosphate-dependent enzyme [Litoribacterium kuwaitense]